MIVKQSYLWLKPDKQKGIACLFVSFLVPFYIPICFMSTCVGWFPFLVSITLIAEIYLQIDQGYGVFGIFGFFVYPAMYLLCYVTGCAVVWAFDKRKSAQERKLARNNF